MSISWFRVAPKTGWPINNKFLGASLVAVLPTEDVKKFYSENIPTKMKDFDVRKLEGKWYKVRGYNPKLGPTMCFAFIMMIMRNMTYVLQFPSISIIMIRGDVVLMIVFSSSFSARYGFQIRIWGWKHLHSSTQEVRLLPLPDQHLQVQCPEQQDGDGGEAQGSDARSEDEGEMI